MIEVKELNGFPGAVYIDGTPLPKQTIPPAISHPNGFLSCECFCDDRIPGCVNPDEVKYQAKPYEVIPRSDSSARRVRFWFAWT